MNNYDLLINRLDAFIRKFYANRLLRGGLIFIACLLAYLLLATVGEYYLYFPAWVKITLLVLLITAGTYTLITWVIFPLLKMQRLGKVISHEQAAGIIGQHFPEVQDKLLNVLQLNQNSQGSESRELIDASIRQKSAQIVLVPFTQAIDLGKNRKYLPYVLPPLLIGVFILFAAPAIFREASSRLLQPAKNFAPPAPFAFELKNKDLRVPLYGDFTLEAEILGDKLPDKVYVQVGKEQLEMEQVSKTHFRYTFPRVARAIDFRLTAVEVTSAPYQLAVLEKPQLQSFEVAITYPAYTGKPPEHLQSLGDQSVPQGTRFQWHLNARNTDEMSIRLGALAPVTLLHQEGKNRWSGEARFLKDTVYTIFLSNKEIGRADSFRYQVQVIPDMHPQVMVQQMQDSVSGQQVLLVGNASDDYGLSRIYFHYEIADGRQQVLSRKNTALPLSKGKVQSFQHYVDLGSLDLQPGQQVNYYVEVWDNDAVNGSKSSRSDVYSYRMYSRDEIDSVMDQNARQISQGLSSGMDQARKMQEDMKEMQNQLLQSENISWEKQQNLKALAEKQEQLRNQLAVAKKRFEEQRKQSAQKNYSEEIKEKQEALQQQLDNLLNKEMAEQMKKLQELMQQLNKDNAFQKMQEMEQQNKLFNMDMERIRELMKKLELQMKLEDMANKLDDLAQREGQLKENTESQRKDNQQLLKDQKEIQKELKNVLQEDMKDADALNKEQQQPEKLDEPKEQGKQADQQMSESGEQLEKGQQQKASQAQSKAQQNLQQMAASMRQMAQNGGAEQIELDIKATRQLLTNLIRLSFDQEQLMNKVKRTPANSVNYVVNAREQNRLRGNARMVKDSLYALSKRIFKIAATINKETSDLEMSLDQTVKALGDRRIPEAVTRQQYAMTSTNNLALLLNEMLENLLQMQAQAQNPGNGSCSTPGGANPKPGQGNAGQMMKDIITGQQKLGSGMQQRPGQGKSGKDGQQGGTQEGSGASGGSDGTAEQIARMAQEQAALRRKIQELSSLLNSKGMNGNSRELQAIQEQMDKNETDMVHRKFHSELLQRQKEIMTRLLEAEKSIRDQEEDDKRSANTGKDEQRPMPPELQQQLQNRQALMELYKTMPPALKPYYKKMAEDYLKQVKAVN